MRALALSFAWAPCACACVRALAGRRRGALVKAPYRVGLVELLTEVFVGIMRPRSLVDCMLDQSRLHFPQRLLLVARGGLASVYSGVKDDLRCAR